MTNDPVYDEQLKLLSQQDFSHPTQDMPLPGNINPIDRFQRAAYYATLLPKPSSVRQAVAAILAIVRNVSVPFGAPYHDFGIYDTEYRTVSDVTNLVYYFELTTQLSTIWINFKDLNLPQGGQPLVLNPYNESLEGDVTQLLTPQTINF